MNIFEAASRAFPNGDGMERDSVPGAMVVEDPQAGYCGILTRDGILYEGWNPTPEELLAEDWQVKERIAIRRRVRPVDHF